jgi:hypothetical protein
MTSALNISPVARTPTRPVYTPPVVKRVAPAVVVVVIGLASGGCGSERDDKGKLTGAGEVSVFDLRVGDCVMNVGSEVGEQRDIEAVPCSKVHDGEVYTNIDLGGGAFPGERFVVAKAERGCAARLRRQAPASKDEISYFTPTARSWKEQDDHQITCLLQYKTNRAGTVAAQNDGA